MDHTYKVQVSEQEANKIKSLTGRSNVSDAIVDLLTLAGRGRLQVRPHGAPGTLNSIYKQAGWKK